MDIQTKLLKGIVAFGLVALPVVGLGCVAQTPTEEGSDEPVASAEEAITANGCPNPTFVGSTNTSGTSNALAGSCAGTDLGREFQYFFEGEPADLGGQCRAYCSQGAAGCGSGWSLTSPTIAGLNLQSTTLFDGLLFDNESTVNQSAGCYNRDVGHRWLALCTCR